MTCTSTNHNKRKCLKKGKVQEIPPHLKTSRGRPKKCASTTFETPIKQPAHHLVSAQPSTISRGGKTIRTGQGVRGVVGGRKGRAATVGRSGRIASSSTTTSQVNLKDFQYSRISFYVVLTCFLFFVGTTYKNKVNVEDFQYSRINFIKIKGCVLHSKSYAIMYISLL